MVPAFWRDRRVLITGHTGFKGSWLTLWLHTMGASVTGLSGPPPSTPSLYEQAGVAGKESGLLRLDGTKAREQLGWTPTWGLAAGLDATARWYASDADPRELTRRQIGAFGGKRPADGA